MNKIHRPTGMFAFTIVWIGQIISLLGSAMTGFALSFWAYQMAPEGIRATVFAGMNVAFIVPLLVVSPFAGALVDRSNRKWMMIISDLAAGLTTVGILILYATHNLQIWHLYVAAIIEGTFQTFQWPAYSAAITLMVDKKHYARTSAMNDLAGNSSGIFAPMLAGAIIGLLPANGVLIILLIDVITFVVAISAIIAVHIPQPAVTQEGRQGQGNIFREAVYGFEYIFKRPSLLGLQLTFLMGNLFSNLAFTLRTPMILARTTESPLAFGGVQTAGAIGGLLGGIVISVWGGPKRKVWGVVGGWALIGLFGTLLMGLNGGIILWLIATFLGAAISPLIDSSNQAIWQTKVAPDVQGRVFSTRRLIAWFATPVAAAVAGPLADFVLEPGMRAGGALANVFGGLVGVGPGAGMALTFVFAGLAILVVAGVAASTRAIRHAETLLPDYGGAERPAAEAQS